MPLFEVDDGAVWWIAAKSQREAYQQWVAISIDNGGYADQLAVEKDLGKPAVWPIMLADATKITIRDDDHSAPCSKCGGSGRVAMQRTLLDVYHADMKQPKDKRALHGVLGCSEW